MTAKIYFRLGNTGIIHHYYIDDNNNINTVDDFIRYIQKKYSKKYSQINLIKRPAEKLLNNLHEHLFEFCCTDQTPHQAISEQLSNDNIILYNEKKKNFFSVALIKAIENDENKYKKLKIDGKIIIMKYESFTFYYTDKESIKNAIDLIRKVFKNDHCRILISDRYKNPFNENEKLKMDEQYTILVYYPIKFRDLINKSTHQKLMDYLSTVYDAQKMLASEIYKDQHLFPENFIFYKKQNVKITNFHEKLKNIHGLGHFFFFEIDRTIKPIEKQKNNYFEAKKQKIPENETYDSFEIHKRKKYTNRLKKIEEELSSSSEEELLHYGSKPQKKLKKNESLQSIEIMSPPKPRSKSVQKDQNNKLTIIKDLSDDSETTNSESKPMIKKNKKRFYPKITRIITEESQKPIKRRSESAPRPSKPQIEREKLQIVFKFDEFNDRENFSKLKAYPFDMRIKDIHKEFVQNYNLSLPFKFKYMKNEYLYDIDENKTIREIEKEIKDPETKKNHNHFIYVETIHKNQKKTKNKIIPKITPGDNNGDDDPFPLRKRKEKYNFIDDDTSKYDILYSPTKKKVKQRNNKNELHEQKQKQNIKPKSNSKLKKIKYFYQTNSDDEILDIELDLDATVLTMKQAIADLNNIKNTANIKIIFAGKDLLDDIVLETLNIGEKQLFVYIRFNEEVLLLTAKALRNLD